MWRPAIGCGWKRTLQATASRCQLMPFDRQLSRRTLAPFVTGREPNMKNLQHLLDELRLRAGSDRKASILVGVSQASYSAWRRGHARPDDDQARRIAELLQLDAAHVAAVLHAERAKTDETRAMWQRVAETFSRAAVLAIVSAAPFMLTPRAAQAEEFNNNGINTHWRRKPRPRVPGVAL